MYKIALSPYAKIFYNEWLLDPNSACYNMLFDQTLYGNLDVEKLKYAWQKYIADHVLLNSHIQTVEGELFWVKNGGITPLEYSEVPVDTEDLIKYVSQNFDLCSGPLYRFKLIKVGDSTHRLIIILHHIVIDGSSASEGLLDNLSNYYNNPSHTIEHSLDQQTTLITTLAKKINVELEHNKELHQKFWREQLSNTQKIDLTFLKLAATDQKEHAANDGNHIGSIRFSFGEAELSKLALLKRKYIVTPYIYGQCIFAILLNRITNQENIAFSFPISIKEGTNFIYGAQLNNIVINYHFDKCTTIINLLNQGREFFKSLKQNNINHSYYPISNIIQENNNKYLLDVCFIQTYLRDQTFNFNGITKVDVSSDIMVDSITGNMFLFEQEIIEHKINYKIRFDQRVYSESLISSFANYYSKLFLDILEDILSDETHKPIYRYNILDDKQYQTLINDFNQTDCDYPASSTVHKLFENQVLATPERIAVVYGATSFTYQLLNQRANQLANYLRLYYNIVPDNLIILCLDKSEQVPLTMLAVMKAGGAYVPIDPKYPDERISYIANDTKAKVILTNSKYQDRIKQLTLSQAVSVDVIAIDSLEVQAELNIQDNSNPITATTSSNLIYVIYTSGTTGKPKGVLLEHKSVVNFIIYMIEYAQLNDQSIGSNYAAFGFDASVTEIYPILLSGGVLHIFKENDRTDPVAVNDYFNEHKVTFAFLPTKFAEFFCQLKNYSLKNLIIAGDKLDKFTAQPYRVINAYGPTEASVHTTSFVVDRPYHNIPIGNPINNVKCYVVDPNLNLQPIGVIGELLIGGECLARGYLNRPELTTEKFIANPFQTTAEKLQNKNARLYKTGDLVRILPDSNLEYIGRNDFQVKIRGFRIELSEIEDRLAHYPEVKHAVVVAKERCVENINDKYLVAYYVADNRLDETQLQQYLAAQLPEYMVPSALVYLAQLPLTINGKLDRKALPEPSFTNNKYESPHNKQEHLICTDFAKVLGLKQVGINDDFFALGGDSLKAITLTSVLQNNFNIKVTDIFTLRTPKEIAKNVIFEKNLLKLRLEKIKLVYKAKRDQSLEPHTDLQEKIDDYLVTARNFTINPSLKKNIVNVLLTGATGYLGCNILNQLLKLTSYNIFLLIRATSYQEAVDRINKKYQFYFSNQLGDLLNSRVFVILADIEQDNLGLSAAEYSFLVTKIDSVIHSAALVKHYGEYSKFYSANVQATINLLQFSALTKLKDFHFISSYSVLTFGFIPDCKTFIYTEDDMPENLKQWYNVYNQTKLQGEKEVIKFRSLGVSANIYRVGNLALMTESCRTQENINENSFFNWLQCIFTIRCIAPDISMAELSQTDLTAQAIVKLFDKTQLTNLTYHVFNPNLFDIAHAFIDHPVAPIKTVTLDQLIDNVTENLSNKSQYDLIVKFLLRQGWLEGWDLQNMTVIRVLQDRTQNILQQLQFQWQAITKETFYQYLKLQGLFGEL